MNLDEMDTHEGLLDYFEFLTQAEPHNTQARISRDLARDWLKMKRGVVNENEFTALLVRIEAPDLKPYFSWIIFWNLYKEWGYALGFAVPGSHPWELERASAHCISCGNYEGQLSIGSRYVIQNDDAEKQQLRITNDEGKNRWYPTALFELTTAPRRTWSRKDPA